MATPFASIITVEELNAFLRETVKPDDDEYLDLKQSLITRCAAAIEKNASIKFQAANYAETFDGDGKYGFRLNKANYPVNSIVSVTQTGTAVAATEYVLLAGISFVKFRNPTISGWQNYVITYNAGYGYTNGATANNVPQDLREACLLWTARRHKQVITKTHGVSSLTAADQSTTYFERGMPEDVQILLAPYRTRL